MTVSIQLMLGDDVGAAWSLVGQGSSAKLFLQLVPSIPVFCVRFGLCELPLTNKASHTFFCLRVTHLSKLNRRFFKVIQDLT